MAFAEWIDSDYKYVGNGLWRQHTGYETTTRDLYALFSGSEASNQREELELWQEVAMIIYEHDGKLVATIDRLKERYHITHKAQQP